MTDESRRASQRGEMTPEVRDRIVRWVTGAALGVVGYGLVLFLTAGRLDWVWGWVFLGVITAFMAAHPLILMPINPELLAERDKGMWDKGVKRWDKWITSLAGGFMFLTWVVAGLDIRFKWSEPVGISFHLAGLLATVLGFALFLWAMASNAFFSEGVRIQEERGHVVQSGGPYRYVRHPGYAGAILAHLGSTFLFGSWWSLIPAVALAVVYVVRTQLEDETLMTELVGYPAYAARVRRRLLPGVW